ncbi:MAG: glycoside hydrolase family 43 protein [Ardenticatenaceae bacterium]|nr:glycoside hydrolase family 43 protein [Ardenticatenaceae bacterium]
MKHWLTRRFNRIVLLLAVGSVVVALVLIYLNQLAPTEPVTFRNPLNVSHGSDPWLVYYEGNYYLAATTWSASVIPGLTMKQAPTINELRTAQPVSVYTDTVASRCCNFWAPEFHLLDGPDGEHWYFYYSGGPTNCCDDQRMHVLESEGTDPMGPYTYKGRLHDDLDGWAIDHTVLTLDGSLYLLFSAWEHTNQNIYIAPMSNPWTISGNRVLISTPTYGWEKQDGRVNEGPEVLQHDGQTYIIYSASACWGPNYKLGMLTYTGGDPLEAASWQKAAEPVFESANGVYGPAHNGFFKSPDGTEDWIVYHANRTSSGGCDVNRTTRIQKFTWNDDGTPNFGEPVALDTEMMVPAGEGGGFSWPQWLGR